MAESIKYTLIIVAALYIFSSKTAYAAISKTIADITCNIHDSNIIIIAGFVLSGWLAWLFWGRKGAAK